LLQLVDIQSGTFNNAKKLVLSCQAAKAFEHGRYGPLNHLKFSKFMPTDYLEFSKFIHLRHLCITDIPSTCISCEFSSEIDSICVEVGSEHPNAKIDQIKLDHDDTTKQCIWQPAHEGPVTLLQIPLKSQIEMPIQKPIITDFTLSIISSNSQGLLNKYLEALQQLYDESNKIKGLLSSQSEATRGLINRFNYLNMQFNCPETQQWLSILEDRSEEDLLSNHPEMGQLLMEYSKIFQLNDHHIVLHPLFESYSKAILQLTEESHNLRLKLSKCSTEDTQQLINSNHNLQILLDEYLTVIHLTSHSDSLKILLIEYSKVEQQLKAKTSFLMTIKKTQKFVSAVQPLLSSLRDLQSTANKRIQWFKNILQRLLEGYSATLHEANSIDQ